MTETERDQAAEILWQAFIEKKQQPPLSATFPEMEIIDAYRIQERFADARIRDGHEVTGYKVGLTSKAMQEVAGADEPDYGVLLDFFMETSGVSFDSTQFFGPAVEIEIAFVMKKALRGPGVSFADVVDATDYVLAAIEIVDFRLEFKNRRAGIFDTVADLASCGSVVLGSEKVGLDDLDLENIQGRLLKNGEEVAKGSSAAVLGNPINAIAWLANKLGEISNVTFEPGHVVLSGSFIKIARAKLGDSFVAEFDSGLGNVTANFR